MFLGERGKIVELIDFGDLYNKTSVERGGMLYNSSPRKIQWVAINQNDLEGNVVDF